MNIVASIGLLVSALASVACRRDALPPGAGDERQQIRPLAWVAATAVVILLLGLALQSFPIVNDFVFTALFAAIGIGMPFAIQNAVLRHRLYDLDVVVKKTVVFAIIVVLLLARWRIIAVLVGFGLVPSLYDTPPLLLFFGLACGLLGSPAYRLATRIADRVVYGGRATPVGGPQRVLGAAVGDLRHRRRAAADGRDRRRSHPGEGGPRVAPGERGVPRGGFVAHRTAGRGSGR